MLLFFVGVSFLVPGLSVVWAVLASRMALYCVVIPGPLEVRVLASQFAGSGQLYFMHFVRLCPSPGGGVPVL